MQAGQPPGFGKGQHDARPAWNAATGDRQLQLVLEPSMAAWRAGAWFIGVVGDHAPAAYQITFQRFACPFNCSGHGECVDSSSPRACRCDDGFSGRDCSKDVRPVAWGEAVTSEPAKFDELFFTLPNATGGMQHGEAGMVVVNASYFGMPSHHLDAHPSILLARVRGLVTACDRVPLRAMCVWQPSTCQQSAHSFHPRSPPPPPALLLPSLATASASPRPRTLTASSCWTSRM